MFSSTGGFPVEREQSLTGLDILHRIEWVADCFHSLIFPVKKCGLRWIS